MRFNALSYLVSNYKQQSLYKTNKLKNYKMSQKRRIRRMTFKHLDAMMRSIRNIAKKWDRNTIPTITLKEVIKKSKPSPTTKDKDVDEFMIKFGITLDKLYNSCLASAKAMNTTNIPVSVIQDGVNIIKGSFIEGQNE